MNQRGRSLPDFPSSSQNGVFADDTAMIIEGVTATKGSAGF